MPFYTQFLPLGCLLVIALAAPAPQNNQDPSWTTTSTVASSSTSTTNTMTGTTATNTLPNTATNTATGSSPTSTACPASLPALTCYRYAADFPPSSAWLSWECLTAQNYPSMLLNNNDSPDEANNVISAIKSVAETAGIDPRIAYAVAMQESTGKVRPIHGDAGKSAGIFQVQIPSPATCDGTTYGTCPLSTITTMAQEGIYGHSGTSTAPTAPGLAYLLNAEGGDVALAVRRYNTGVITDSNDLTDIATGTPAYVSDIANRLVGGLVGSPRPYTC